VVSDVVSDVNPSTTPGELATLCELSIEAERELVSIGREGRSRMLFSMADALEHRRTDLVEISAAETALTPQRLDGELTRTAYQLRQFAEVVDEGSYLEATIDHASSTPMGPRPDLRRILRPLGPVAVFGASNFPFAFSVPGGDSASALAAGCPVLAKVHEAHPATSIMAREALMEGARTAGVRSEVVSLVFGQDAGVALVEHPSIQAVGFTGSPGVGRLLHERASQRPTPIPFYGELGALNAVVVCEHAAKSRGRDIGRDLVGSFTLGVGQFCTKPGLVLLPSRTAGDEVIATMRDAVHSAAAGAMLSARTAQNFALRSTDLRDHEGVQVLAEGMPPTSSDGWWARPLLLHATPEVLEGIVTEECFGPVLVVVNYDSPRQLLESLDRLGAALTATVHADPPDEVLGRMLLDQLTGKVGRIVWNGYPTGVAVTWAMHHGGPYPASIGSIHTSVGQTAIRRWMRPISYQDVPSALLPAELHDTPRRKDMIVRRVDGILIAPTQG
jgi:NADP-dependent aldehyde dehydrogenase